MKHIKIELNPESIQKAIDEINLYKNSLTLRVEKFVKLLAEHGEDLAVLNVKIAAKYSFIGLTEGIYALTLGNGKALVVSSAPHSIFFEFGTGVVGKDVQHPDQTMLALLGWEYDVNSHGEIGWWYPTDESDGNPFKKQGKDGQWYAWTKGLESNPFMYDTAQMLRMEAADIARGVFEWK